MGTELRDKYNIVLPELSAIANMQEAFYKYHYGTSTFPTKDEEITNTSLVGYLNAVIEEAQAIVDDTAVVNEIDPSRNLNTVVDEGGNYIATVASTANNYPTNIGGLLRVIIVSSGSAKFVFQTYQSISTGPSTGNDTYWRSAYSATGVIGGPSWSSWKKTQSDPHDHDNLYYQKNAIDNRLSTSITPFKIPETDANGKIITDSVDGVDVSELQTLKGILGTSVSPDNRSIFNRLADKANATHAHDDLYHRRGVNGAGQPRIWIKDPATGTPGPAAVGDLWFW